MSATWKLTEEEEAMLDLRKCPRCGDKKYPTSRVCVDCYFEREVVEFERFPQPTGREIMDAIVKRCSGEIS